MKPASEMTMEECREETRHGCTWLPLNLEGAAAALPDKWKWSRVKGKWHANEQAMPMTTAAHVEVPDTGDEMLDRFRLAVAARRAMG